MGRTLPTFNTFLQQEESSWRSFRRALRNHHERAAFDHLFTRARVYTAEATSAARAVPFDAIVLSILLSQEMELQRLRERLEHHEAAKPPPPPPASPPPPEDPEDDSTQMTLL